MWTRRRVLAGAGALASGALLSNGMPRTAAWAAQGSQAGSLRLVFYTDVHARTEWKTPVAMQRAAEAINAHKADLVIAGGDLITDGFQSSAATVAPRWDAYMAMHEAIEGDIYPAIGNHDLVAAIPEDGTAPAPDPRAIFRDKMGLERTYYSFDAAGYHFIVLDSVQVVGGELKYQGVIWPEEMAWVQEDLALIPKHVPIVLVLHIPLLTAFYAAIEGNTVRAPSNRVVVNNRQVLDLFEGRNLVLVLQGHLHINELLRWRDTTFITGGAVCARWWRGPWHGTEEGFCVLNLHGNRVEWNYVDYGWEARRPPNQ
jgi:3',5'-cyclic AMP phosphodiesterase CpdA